MPVRAGQVIAGKYRVDELLGAGASGMVVAAKHLWLRYSVSLKILAAYTDGQIEGLQRQVNRARVAARLRGPHIARIRDIGITQDKMPYVATERLEGRTLEAELAEKTRLPIAEAVRWVLQACEGLAEAHAIDLEHGDLKPANLFLANTPDGDRVVIP
jgi:eukaryotic-like serine/threonine-protein kinase